MSEKGKQYIVKEEKQNKKKNKTKKKGKAKKIILIVIITIVLLLLIGGGVLAGIFFGVFGDEFKIDREDLIISRANSTIVDYKTGELVATLTGDEKRKIISLADMPEYLPKAFIAIEDERFYEHHGIDIKRTLGAIATYIFNSGDSSFGGSTITQQVVKNITKEDERHWTRKVKEWGRAYNIEKMLSKDQILELYLNLIFMGGAQYCGVELGSIYYFNKSASELSLAEAAFLAGINHSPNWYNPFQDDEDGEIAEKIKSRTKTVLAKMKELGYIPNEEDYNKAVEEVDNGLKFEQGSVESNLYSYHVEATIEQVIEDYMEEKGCTRDLAEVYVYSGGLKIYSTQDTSIQKIMEDEYKKDKYVSTSRVNKDEETGEYKKAQSAMVIIDHKTGYVVGTVGGLGEKTESFGFNRATQATRPTGSSMKPIAVLAPALEEGLITAGSVYDDVPTTFGKYSPVNYYGGYKGLSTVRYVIEISQNIIPVKILTEVGFDKSVEFLREMGISTLTDDDKTYSLALGGLTYGVSPLEMAAAYATIANDGVYIEPTFYTKVEDSNGEVVLEPNQESRRVMTTANAYILKSILTAPVTGTDRLVTARVCAIPGMDVAAKTGTTSDDYDRWLCGFTPYYTAATWYGFDDNERIRWGYNISAHIWDAIMTEIHEPLENKKFEEPEGIVRVSICKKSGLVATTDCKNALGGSTVYTEVFVNGTQPKKTCDCHVKAKVCEVKSGEYQLATDNCPNAKELVFITRENSDKNTSWRRAADAIYMLPTVTCTRHTSPVEEPNDVIDNNNPSGGNETGNTTGNETGNQTGNETGNTTGNETGNETGNTTGNETGNETGNTTGNETSNETEGNNTNTDT